MTTVDVILDDRLEVSYPFGKFAGGAPPTEQDLKLLAHRFAIKDGHLTAETAKRARFEVRE